MSINDIDDIDEFHLHDFSSFCAAKAHEVIKLINGDKSPKEIHIDLMNFVQGIYWEGFRNGKKKIRENLRDYTNEIISKIMEE